MIAGLSALGTKKAEGRLNRQLKAFETRAATAKEILVGDLAAQGAALLDTRLAVTKANHANDRWVMALYEGHKERDTQDAAFGTVDAILLCCARVPLTYRPEMEKAAEALKSRLQTVLQDARENESYNRDEELCGKAATDLGEPISRLVEQLDVWERALRAERDRLVKGLNDS